MQIKSFHKVLIVSLSVLAGMFGLMRPTNVHAATTPSLGAATSYGILSSTFTNTAIGTTINGDIGFTTPPAVVPGGVHTNYGSSSPYSAAGIDQGSALTSLNNEVCSFTFAPGAIDLSTDITHGDVGVYEPGVYCSVGAMTIGGPLTLSGAGTHIFRTLGALNSTAGAVVSVTNGASACDAFWTPTQLTTLGADTTFIGTVIDDAGITIGANTTWVGRALSFGETITTDATTITVPTCTSPIGTLNIIKLVVNATGGAAISSDFALYVMSGNSNVLGSPASGNAIGSGTSYTLLSGTYTVSENINSSYSQTFAGDCNASGSVVVLGGENKTCTIINTFIPVIIRPVGAGRSYPPVIVPPTLTTGTLAVVPVFVGPPLLPVSIVYSGLALGPIPSLPDTGLFAPSNNSSSMSIIAMSMFLLLSVCLVVLFRNHKIIKIFHK